MSSVQSLGLHEPCALSYLVAEAILPPSPSPTLYTWTTSQFCDDDGSGLVEEEVLRTDHAVVWSRNGAVKRALNLNIEEEAIIHAFVTQFAMAEEGKDTILDRGLVVVLKTQAHIFLLSGDSYVLPLSFEVETAFPFSMGFVLQRKLADNESQASADFPYHDLSTINETLTSIGGDSSRPSLILPEAQHLMPRMVSQSTRNMPRTFAFTEIMSELGLVVCSPSRKGEALEDCGVLPRSETLIYLSTSTAFANLGLLGTSPSIALTVNKGDSTFTLWNVCRKPVLDDRHAGRPKQPSEIRSRKSQRKTSNMYAREKGNLRESLLGSRSGLAAALPLSSLDEQKSFAPNDLASQLGPEFSEVGVQTRSARRVSSMLARTDLGSAADRNTFNELATGHPGRQSLNRAGRRGESIGSFNDRQSVGFRRRSSFPTNASMFSTGTSFLDVSARGLLDDVDPLRQSVRHEDESFEMSESSLPRSIGFFKLKSFAKTRQGDDIPSLTDVKVSIVGNGLLQSRDGLHAGEIYVSILDKLSQELVLVRVLLKVSRRVPSKSTSAPDESVDFKATETRRIHNVKDACLVTDDYIQRLVIYTESRAQASTLQLEAPWSPSFQLELPHSYALHDPSSPPASGSGARKETGMGRVMTSADVRAQGLSDSGTSARFLMVDQDFRRHVLGIQLVPEHHLVRRVFQMCDLIFPDQPQSLLVLFWEVSRWLRARDITSFSEWTAMVVVLFSLAVPFMSSQDPKSTPSRRKKTGLLRSSSGVATDLTDFYLVQGEMDGLFSGINSNVPAWNWITGPAYPETVASPKSKHQQHRGTALSQDDTSREHNNFLLKCVSLARDFVQTPPGEAALGPEGYLPVSISKDRIKRCNAVPSILLGLHLLYEEGKLNVTTSKTLKGSRNSLVLVLAQLGRWVGWKDWTSDSGGYYEHEAPEVVISSYDESVIDGLSIPAQPFVPPSIYQKLESWIIGTASEPFLTFERISTAETRHPENPMNARLAALTPCTTALLALIEQHPGSSILDSVAQSSLTEPAIRDFPDGLAAAFHQALASMTLSKDEGKKSFQNGSDVGANTVQRQNVAHTHDAVHDYHTICSSALEADTIQRWDASSEADRQNITRLMFSKDRRFQDASKLVNQTRPPMVECSPEPDWSEVDLLEAQKELAQHVTRRTLSVAAGRGMMHFTARVPLLTERVPIPAFSLQCIMKPRNTNEGTQAMTFSADKANFTEEKVCWAFFHNGASMGLMISNDAQGIDTSWILYNKPPELTNRHAGFLLALGLNGHLKNLAKWVAFKYLTPKHTMTSIGLLLGLSASYIGTMDTLITRLLSVHVTRLLPPGAAELNLSPLTQTTGIMGIGLLYYNSHHRRMSEVMLSEIENNDPEEGVAPENVLRDEGYRLAAGFALGLINLGQGKHLSTLHDMGVVERLLTIAVGTKNVNMVHVLDRATAGAVMALAFVFMKTNVVAIAEKVDVPDTLHQFDYVRPDIFLLRTLARHLIMWDAIQPTQHFVEISLPMSYRIRADLRSTKALSSEDMPFFNILAGICFALGMRFAGSQRHDVRDLLISYLDQFLRLSRLSSHNYDARVTLNSLRNCLDTVALASASVMAGSGDLIVMRRLRALHGRVDKDTPFGSHLAAHMALGTLFLAGGTRTFSTSNLAVAALCIAFYPLFPNDVLDNRGHLQALRHLWVLAVDSRCLVARDGNNNGPPIGEVTALINMKDGSTHELNLPALVPELHLIHHIEITGEAFWDERIDFSNDPMSQKNIMSQNGINVVLRRRAAYDKPEKDLFASELQARAEETGIPSIDPNRVALITNHNTSVRQGASTKDPFTWLFDLEALKAFDHAERALVLNPTLSNGEDLLKTTVVDTRLELEQGILPSESPTIQSAPTDRDRVWQLRLLFAWFDRMEKDDAEIDERLFAQLQSGEASEGVGSRRWFSEDGGTWLRREVVDRLKWRVWRMASGKEGSENSEDDMEEEEEL